MRSHLNSLCASNKDLIDELCPTYVGHITQWLDTVSSSVASIAPHDVAEQLAAAVLNFSVESASEAAGRMKTLLHQVCVVWGAAAPQTVSQAAG